MSRHRPIVTCASCGQQRTHEARGLCTTCSRRHRADGTLDQYPRTKLSRADRYEDWLFLEAQGLTRAQAAERMGISKKGLEKVIERTLRAQQRPEAA